MEGEIVVPKFLIKNLEAVASSVFPMEIDAQISIREINEQRIATSFELRYDSVDKMAFVYSQNFNGLITCLEHNHAPKFIIEELKTEHENAEKDFEKYTQCQNRRQKGDCSSESIQSLRCKSCEAYGQPRLKGMYDWFSSSPSIAWHSHVTSEYGCIRELSKPSDADKLLLARRIVFNKLPIQAEMITCTSTNNEQITNIFYLNQNEIPQLF